MAIIFLQACLAFITYIYPGLLYLTLSLKQQSFLYPSPLLYQCFTTMLHTSCPYRVTAQIQHIPNTYKLYISYTVYNIDTPWLTLPKHKLLLHKCIYYISHSMMTFNSIFPLTASFSQFPWESLQF